MATLEKWQTAYRPVSALPCFLRCLSVSCVTCYINTYAKKNCYTQNSLDFGKVILLTILLFNTLITSTSPLKLIITRIYRFIQNIWYRSFIIAKKTRNVRRQYHNSCLVYQLRKWHKTVYKNYSMCWYSETR